MITRFDEEILSKPAISKQYPRINKQVLETIYDEVNFGVKIVSIGKVKEKPERDHF